MSGKKISFEDQCSCYAASSGDRSCPPVYNATHPLRYYEFTQDEMKALEECDTESFYHRCLPLSTVFATATYAAVRNGFWAPSPHFGALPKVAIAALVGHLSGRVAYVPHCERKLRKLPGQLGDVMRNYHRINNPPPAPPKK